MSRRFYVEYYDPDYQVIDSWNDVVIEVFEEYRKVDEYCHRANYEDDWNK